MAPPDTRTFFQKTYDTVTNFANNLYTGADTLVGGILPGGQDITQGYIADIGRSIGLPISTGIPGGVASTIDTPSIQPVLESDNLSLEEVFAQPLDAGVSTGTMGLGDVFSAPLDGGTMGLEAAFGGGGGFIPQGITSEASMVEYGIGDGWVPNATYEQVSISGGMGSAPREREVTRVTELPNNNYAVYVENYDTGKIESFVQKGTDGRQGITDYYSNSTTTENNQTISSDRLYGIDISALIGASVVDPNSTLKKSTQPVAVDQFYGKAPLPGMERIDTLNDAQLLTEIDIQEPGIPGGGSSDPFEKRVLDTINVIENNVSSDELPSNPYIQAIKDGKSIEDLFGIKIGGAEEEIVVNDLNTTLPASDNNSSLADAFASGGLADGNQTATNNINPDGNQNPQISLDQNATNEASIGGNADISKNVATGIGTSIVDGNEFEFVYDPSKVDPTVTESQLNSGFKLFSEEAFREFDDSLRVSTGKNPIPDSAGSNDQGFDLDLFSKARADFIDVYQKSGATIDQINDLKQQVNKIDLIGKAKNILPTLDPNNFIGTVQSIIKIPTRFKLFQNSADSHNIRQSQIKDLNPIREDLAEEAGMKYEDVKDILNMELTLPQKIQEVENIIEQVETSGIDADLTPVKELLTELQTADLYGKDVAILKDSDYDRIYSNEDLDSTIDGLEDVDLSKDDYVKVYNHKGEEVSNTNIYSENTKREPESWGVINEDGGAVAKWNPFEPESRQERDMRNTINPNRGFGDGTGLDPIKYPDQASMGYSSPTMATIDRNIRPTLDRVGDILETPLEAAGLGMYNTIGRLPLVGGAGKSIGNALARTGQGIDRAIDTKLPDALFGLKTGDDGDDGSKMSKEEMDEILRITERNGISPLTELMRDKYLYGGTGNDSYSGGYADGSPYLNSVSNGSMSIYGGTNAPGIASTGVPGGIGGSSNADNSGGKLDGLGSMSAGFDLSTSEGQEKFADLYGEDRLMDELSKRGIFDRRSSYPEDEALAKRDVYAGSDIADYTIKNLDEKPKPNIGQEIAEGIKNAQIEEKGIFA
jgi:hypothetical protein